MGGNSTTTQRTEGFSFCLNFQTELQLLGWCWSSYSGCLLKLLIECLVLLEELEAHEKTFCSRGLTIIDIFENCSVDNSSGIITTLSESLLRRQRYNAPVCVCVFDVYVSDN